MGKASYLFGIFPYCNRSNPNSGKLDFIFSYSFVLAFHDIFDEEYGRKMTDSNLWQDKEYEAYKDRTNRCIPRIPKK